MVHLVFGNPLLAFFIFTIYIQENFQKLNICILTLLHQDIWIRPTWIYWIYNHIWIWLYILLFKPEAKDQEVIIYLQIAFFLRKTY